MEHRKLMNAQQAKTVYSYKNVKERLHRYCHFVQQNGKEFTVYLN
jgi:hypothetical protein